MKSQFRTYKCTQISPNQISGLNKLELCHLVAVDIPPQRSPSRYQKDTTVNSVWEKDGQGDYDRVNFVTNTSTPYDNLTVNTLEGISIAPTLHRRSRTLSLHQTFTFQKPDNRLTKTSLAMECSTQTSKTLVNESIANDLHISSETNISARKGPISGMDRRFFSVNSLLPNQTENNERPFEMAASTDRSKLLKFNSRIQDLIQTRRFSSNLSVHTIVPSQQNFKRAQRKRHDTNFGNDETMRSSIAQVKTPLRQRNVAGGFSEVVLTNRYHLPKKSVSSFQNTDDVTSVFSENLSLASIIEKLFSFSWEITLEGMHELLYIAPRIEWSENLRESIIVQRKLLECFRSPRSTIRRVACQVTGEMFRIIKCTRRPEFDELTEELLAKSADTNRFIQRDANNALDKMVANLPAFHVVRAVCTRAPLHKNPVIRATSARLLIGVCSIHSVDVIIGLKANVYTRKRVLASLAKFLVDRNQETRKYGDRLCKLLRKHRFFQEYFFKDMETNAKNTLKKIINHN